MIEPSTPAEEGFFMPPEWAPHARTWMAWPARLELWGERMMAAKLAYAAVARAIAPFEPVSVLARPEDVAEARLACGRGVQVRPMPLEDSWMRDFGPTFVIDTNGKSAGIQWEFNGWGGKFKHWENDAVVAGRLLAEEKLHCFAAPLVVEGGAFHVDGLGTLIATEECLLNPNRNPELTKQEVEAALARYLGIRRIVWLEQGLVGDVTDGHVDNIACFAGPGRILAAVAEDRHDPSYAILQENLATLRAAHDSRRRPFEVIEVPLPRPREEGGQPVVQSYLNLYPVNGAVIVPTFEDPADQQALARIAEAFPERRVVPVAGRDIALGGGNVHCITQQQPQALRI